MTEDSRVKRNMKNYESMIIENDKKYNKTKDITYEKYYKNCTEFEGHYKFKGIRFTDDFKK